MAGALAVPFGAAFAQDLGATLGGAGAVFTAVVFGVHFFLGVHLGAAFAVALGAHLALGFHFVVAFALAAAAGWD